MEQGFWALFLFLGMAEPCLGFVEEMILDLGSSPPSQIVQPFDEVLFSSPTNICLQTMPVGGGRQQNPTFI